ncbi:bifunctional folylpolyglutamate synthase/dihydrofolate synthase [Streptococcus pantholopis]|uniref:tetrahydrofolate synthase n=1 Tax=Streptococcus pantholopis TaxID=1811193 RepID=A0A172Q6U0_9STRE|nr:folylpolyglutamate synthase/dihydrofolate synthase family protein [Streptococcus pantholopis]AND79176.1 dihydrofolate synthase [Streptococcus pantholopis]
MDYKETLTWIHSYKAKGRRPKQARMLALLEKLDNPQQKITALHIVGTNGKGSTVSFLQHILTASGYTAGTFTSPFITRFNERIAINQQPISDKDLCRTAALIRPLVEDEQLLSKWGRPTEFELVTLLMFTYFARIKPVDLALIEAGVGGTRDATNVFTPLAVICPSISYDHQETLGSSLSQIASHKVGVLSESTPLIFGQFQQEARLVFYQRAALFSAPTYELGKDFFYTEKKDSLTFCRDDFCLSDIQLQLLGEHQKSNAALAAMAALLLSKKRKNITAESIKTGLQKATWPGRAELISPHILLDGAHNEEAMQSLTALLEEHFADKKIYILFAGLKRKPIQKMLACLTPYDLIVTSFDFPGAEDLENYSCHFKKVEDWHLWLKMIPEQTNDLYVVTGSLYFISEVRRYLLASTDSHSI